MSGHTLQPPAEPLAHAVRQGSRPGRYALVALAIMAFGLAMFGLLAFNVVSGGPLTAEDQPVAQGLHALARMDPRLIFLVAYGSGSLGREVALVGSILLGLYFLWKRNWVKLSMLMVGVGTGEFMFESLSHIVNRHRPVFPDPIEVLPGPGFPSGHSITSFLFSGFIVYLLWPRLRSRGWKALAVIDVVALALLIGFSRLYVGQHFLTDVLAGYCLGLAWGSFVWLGFEINRLRGGGLPR